MMFADAPKTSPLAASVAPPPPSPSRSRLRRGDPVRILPPPHLSTDPLSGGRLDKVDQRGSESPITIHVAYPAGPMTFDGDGRAKAANARGWRIHPEDLARIELPIRPVIERYASFDDARMYRYLLVRSFVPLEEVRARTLVVMLNPSVADDKRDDPTVKKLLTIGRKQGWDSITVANLFARIATKPRVLRDEADAGLDVVGPGNDTVLRREAERATTVVVAGGSSVNVGPKAKVAACRGRGAAVLALLRSVHPTLYAFRITTKNAPEHPLFLASDIGLVRFTEEA